MAPPSKPPSLSSLQAQLRTAKRPAEEAPSAPPKKRAALAPALMKAPARPSVVKAPGPSADRPDSGLSAKAPPAAPASTKPTGAVTKAAPATGGKAPGTVVKRVGAPPERRPSNGALAGEADDPALAGLLLALDAASGSAKLHLLGRLASSLGQRLQIEQINQFLRILKKKLHERATADGVPIPSDKTLAKMASAAKAGAKATQSVPVSVAVKAAAESRNTSIVKSAPAASKTSVAKSPSMGVRAAAVKSPAATKAISKVPAQSSSASAKALAKVASKPAKASASDSNGRDVASLPPPSPPPDEELAESDPLYVLVGELSIDPVCESGELKEARLDEVLKRLWGGTAKRPKDWVVAWQAMVIPVEKQAEALQKILHMAFAEEADEEKAPKIIAELVINLKVKMRNVEEVLVAFGHDLESVLAKNDEAWHVYAHFLTHLFPKPQGSGWGWSRVGWSWQSWWQFVEKCVQSLDGDKAFDVIAMTLRLVQDKEGMPLAEVQAWSDGDKLSKVSGKLAELGSCSVDEVVERLGVAGVATDGLV